MANIKTFEASDAETNLRPSETGSAAFVRSGTVEREYSDQSARLMRESGRAWGEAFKEVGQGIETVAEHAQATTDAQAMLEANKDSSALDLHSLQQIQEMGKPKLNEKSGEMEVATSAEATQAAATMHDTYQQTQQAIRDKMVAAGASKKALNTFDERANERQSMHAAHLNSEVHSIAAIEATTNYDKSTNSAAALAEASPGDLDLILQGWRKDTNMIFSTGIFSKEAAEAMGPKAIEAQRHIITSALESKARSGPEGLFQAQQDVRDPKYAPYIGTNVNALSNTLNRFAREEAAEKRQQAAEADRAEKKAADARVGAYNQDRQPGDPLYDFKQDPYARKNPEWARTMRALSEADRDPSPVDPKLSDDTRDQLFNTHILNGSGDAEAAQHDIDVARGQRKIGKTDYAELTEQARHLDNPENKRIYSEMKEFLGPNGYGPSIAGPVLGDALVRDQADIGRAMHDARTYVQQRIAEIQSGKDPLTNNPMDLFREGSKVFLGDDKNFTAKYLTSDVKIKAVAGGINPSGSAPVPMPRGLDVPAQRAWVLQHPGRDILLPDGTIKRVKRQVEEQ